MEEQVFHVIKGAIKKMLKMIKNNGKIAMPVCGGIYSKYYVLRFASKNPCQWLKYGR